ncbi:MAG: guanylate kinase [Planctomycetota bacterium]
MGEQDVQTPGLLVILSGPSGVGKSTITHAICEQLGAVLSVSMTTRPVTPQDVEGEDYFFVSEREFKDQVKLGQMLEYAQVFDNFYGTPREPVEDALAQGAVVMLEIDVQGAAQVKRNLPGAFAIFIEPPSERVLLDRLRHRQRENEATIQKRFSRARHEIAEARSLGIYDRTIVNDDLPRAIHEAVGVIHEQLVGG